MCHQEEMMCGVGGHFSLWRLTIFFCFSILSPRYKTVRGKNKWTFFYPTHSPSKFPLVCSTHNNVFSSMLSCIFVRKHVAYCIFFGAHLIIKLIAYLYTGVFAKNTTQKVSRKKIPKTLATRKKAS